jgi:type I restriction enzyme, S subunit
MASEWISRPLEDCMAALIDYRGKTPEKKSFGIPLITAKIVKGGRIETPQEFISVDDYELWMRRGIPESGDIVITTEAPLGEVAQLGIERIALAQRLITLRGKKGLLDNNFLKFLMQSENVQNQLHARATGTTVLGIKQSELRKIVLTFPPIEEQRAIARILGTLDEKIELNRRMSETLEEMARALFKSWFVDFDPVRAKAEGRDTGLPSHIADLFPSRFVDSEMGEIPEGWEVTTIGAVAYVTDCLHSKKPERRESGLPLLQLSNIRDDGLIDMKDTYFVDASDYQTWVSRMEASSGDCVITNVGRVGAVAQMPSNQKAALGRNMTGIRCKPSFPFKTVLIECLLSKAMKDEIVRKMDTGTILDALNVRSIPRLRFVRPSAQKVLDCFEHKARPLRAQMELQFAETRTLAGLRDALLPKLVSGELRLQHAERFISKDVA